MSLDLLFDPLFRVPFLVGFCMALALPLLGNLLRLRDEWLAALGLAHLAGAGGLLGLAAGMPVVIGAPLGAIAGALTKSYGRFRGNTVYAVMIMVGWTATLLIAANTALGSVMGHALVEGQLYFASWLHLAAVIALILLIVAVLPSISSHLIRARLFPGLGRANRLPAWRWHVGFDLLVALGMALGTSTLGLMGAFALVFVPPLIVFRFAPSWHVCQWLSLIISVAAFILAFVVALALDQPFGPVLVAVLVTAAGLAELGHLVAYRRTGSHDASLPASADRSDLGQ